MRSARPGSVRKHRDPGHSRVDPLLERVEVGHTFDDDHDLAVDDGAGRQLIESGVSSGK